MGEAGAVVPERPADVACRGRGGARAAEAAHGIAGSRHRKYDRRGERRQAPEHDQDGDDRIHRHDGRDIEKARRALADEHRQRADLVAFVERHLVDMLAHQNAHHAQAVGQGREHRVRRNRTRDHRVAAADHQRAPDHEHREFAQPLAFQRRRGGVVEEQQRDAGDREEQRGCASFGEEIGHHRKAERAENRKAGQQRARVEHAARDWMHGVAHARGIRRVVAALETEIIVAEVADHMRDDEADQHQHEVDEVETTVARREQSRDHRRLRGDHQDDAARGVEKSGDRVEAPHLFKIRLVEASEGAPPDARP